MSRIVYFRLLGFEVYAESHSVTRGRLFIDALIQRGELLVWFGQYHAIITPPWWKAKARPAAIEF